ncbi:MAG TPA: hypothetical protein VIK89_13915 [Cytophagaceae bacterium]
MNTQAQFYSAKEFDLDQFFQALRFFYYDKTKGYTNDDWQKWFYVKGNKIEVVNFERGIEEHYNVLLPDNLWDAVKNIAPVIYDRFLTEEEEREIMELYNE